MSLLVVHQVASNLVSVLGILLNLLLLILLVKRPVKQMHGYSRVLLHNGLANLVHSVCILVACPLIMGFKGYTFAFVNNQLNNDAVYLQTVVMTVWLFSYLTLVTSLPVQFIYRYLLVIKGKTITSPQYVAIVCLSLFLNLPFCLTIYLGQKYLIEHYHGQAAAAGTDPREERLPAMDGIDLTPAIVLVPATVYSFLCHGMSMVLYLLVYVIISYTSFTVFKRLKQTMADSAIAVRNLQGQVSRIMAIQALIPGVVQFLPVLSIFVTASVPSFDSVLWCFPSCILLAAISPATALSVLLIIKPYREFIVNMMTRNQTADSSVHQGVGNGLPVPAAGRRHSHR